MSASPRVLLVSPEYPPIPGGVGDYTALLARHLGLMGATVSVLTSGTGGEDSDGDNIHVLRTVSNWGGGLTERIHAAIRRTNAEIVHIQYQTGMYGMRPAVNILPWRLGLHVPLLYQALPETFPPPLEWSFRVVTTFHDLRAPYLFPKAGPLRDGVTRFLARSSDAVIATNGADRAMLRRWKVQPALVPIGSNIPPASWVPTRVAPRDARARFYARYGIPADAALLTTFGLLNQSKGLETVIDALALLQADGVPAHLLIVGAGVGANDPTNRATDIALTAHIAAQGLADVVRRTGPLSPPEVAEALAIGSACLLPYRDGASPRRGSLLAALTQGVPVVTTIPEQGAYDGLPPLTDALAALVPPDDAAALTAAVRHILGDTTYAMQLGTGAYTYAAQFGWGAIARRTLAVYAGEAEMHTPWPGAAAAQVGAGTETGQGWQ